MNSLFCVTILLALSSGINSQECVTYNFEDNLDELYESVRSCDASPAWDVGYYTIVNVTPPHASSTKFIYPSETSSCLSSLPFYLDPAGTLEVNAYMNSVSLTDEIVVSVRVINPNGNDVMIGQGRLASTDGSLVSTDGIQTIGINWFGITGTHYSYLVFTGSAAESSTVFIDSFRYTPPDLPEDYCEIYEDNIETTYPSTEIDETSAVTETQSDQYNITEASTTESQTSQETTLISTTNEEDHETVTEIMTTTESNGDVSDNESETDTESSTVSLTTATEENSQENEEGEFESDEDNDIDDNINFESEEESEDDNPIIESTNRSFWNPLTISTISLLILIILSLFLWCFYECGRKKSSKAPHDIIVYDMMNDFENLPKPVVMPRVQLPYKDTTNSLYSTFSNR